MNDTLSKLIATKEAKSSNIILSTTATRIIKKRHHSILITAMKFSFQKDVACSQMTLPIVGALSVLLWFVLPDSNTRGAFANSNYGAWQFMHASITEGQWTQEISLALCALTVYLMAELNNANMLLRVSSRMLSSMLALTLAISLNCHRLQPGLILMVLSMLSFFPLFASYRQPRPQLIFVSFNFVSLASLVFPMTIWVAPVYWILTGMMRAFTLRCFVASLLAILLPYWIIAGAATYFGCLPLLLQHFTHMVASDLGNYSCLDTGTAALAIFTTLLFYSGATDFYINRLLDRSRTRTTLNVIFVHGCALVEGMAILPQYINVIQPVLLIDTAIMFGHFFTLTHTRFSHIYMISMLILAIVTVLLQCGTFCQDTCLFVENLFTTITHTWF